MNKKFLKLMFLGLAVCSLPVSFTSCKDYDEDIKGLRQETSDLESQISALQTALETANQNVTNAQKAADDAMTAAQAAAESARKAQEAGDAAQAQADAALAEAQAAKVAAEEAKVAAEQAKADAIEEAIAQCKALLEDYATTDDLEQAKTDLGSRIEGIENGLNTLTDDVDELKKWREALDVQLDALENFESRISTIESNISTITSDLTALTGTVEGLQGDIEALQNTIEGLPGQIDELKEQISNLQQDMLTASDVDASIKAAIDELSASFDEKLDGIIAGATEAFKGQLEQITANLNTIANVLSFRLTSLSLMPTLYIDGIPSIEFRSLQYDPKVFNNGKIENEPGASAVLVSNKETKVQYHVSPSRITKDYIASADFLSLVAETRSGEGLISVEDFDIADGVMTVTAVKNNTNSLNGAGNKINTVALKAVLADKSLTDQEKEAGAEVAVFSEYARLAETTVTPFIAEREREQDVLVDPLNIFNDSTTVYAMGANGDPGNVITESVYYNGSLDLHTVATGAYTQDSKNYGLDQELLKTYGMTFRFAVAAGTYELGGNHTNQQAFASIDENGVLTSKLPDGTSDNRAAVGKEPIIRVVLVDTVNNNLVDQRYFKVRFTEEESVVEDIDLGEIWTTEGNLSCSDLTFNYTWEDMTNAVYAKIGENGMSKEDFHRIYTDFSYSGDGKVVCNSDTPNAGTYALTWTLTSDDLGSLVPELKKEYTGTITFSDPSGNRGDVIFKIKTTISATAPSIHGYNNLYWQTPGEIYRVTPIHYGSPEAGLVCAYNNDIIKYGFNLNDDKCLLDNLLSPCGVWEMQFANTNIPAGYKVMYAGQYDATKGTTINSTADNYNGYLLYTTDGKIAARLQYEAGHMTWTDRVVESASLMLNKDNAKSLIGQYVTLNVWADLNGTGDNILNVHSFQIYIVPPLTIDVTVAGSFTDGIYEGSKVSANALTMTDFRGQKVANTEDQPKALYDYYEVNDPAWDLTAAKINIVEQDGSLVVDPNATYENALPLSQFSMSLVKESDNLVFYNQSGSLIEQEAKIFVPVTVTYGWGEETKIVEIPLKPGKIQE